MSENLQLLIAEFRRYRTDDSRRIYVIADILAELGAIHNTPQEKQTLVTSVRRIA